MYNVREGLFITHHVHNQLHDMGDCATNNGTCVVLTFVLNFEGSLILLT